MSFEGIEIFIPNNIFPFADGTPFVQKRGKLDKFSPEK